MEWYTSGPQTLDAVHIFWRDRHGIEWYIGECPKLEAADQIVQEHNWIERLRAGIEETEAYNAPADVLVEVLDEIDAEAPGDRLW